jgi:acetylornithine deacetylase
LDDKTRARLAAAIDVDLLVADTCTLIAAGPDETRAQAAVADIAGRLGLVVQHHEEPLDQLRRSAGYPGEEVERDRLVTVTATARGADPNASRLCLSGHVDVVPPGERAWAAPPFTGRVADGRIHGRGAADMKAGVIAGLHGLAAVVHVCGAPPGDVVVHSVVAEEDGGVGAFAALRRDDDFAGCLIAEPTDARIVCAHGGALTWTGVITGRAAHASDRLSGVSALDRFLPVYAALQRLEVELNAEVSHPLMRELALPYPLSVGRVTAGNWASTVPDELVFEGRIGVPVGTIGSEVRRRLEATVAAASSSGEPVRITWTGGQFEPAETAIDHPLVSAVRRCAEVVTGRLPALGGVAYGSDMRHYCARGIPTVMFGPGRLAQAHATDESVDITAVVDHALVVANLAGSFGLEPRDSTS